MSEADKSSPKVALLGIGDQSTRIVYHALCRQFGPVSVVLEDTVPRLEFLRRRVAKLGIVTVAGQMLFVATIAPLLRRTHRRRAAAILREHGLDDSAIDVRVVRVASVNAPETREILRKLAPTVVVINGTRIIGSRTLGSVSAPFINMHAGITPAYRGVHGGYWALVDRRSDLVGTTVHLVDEGIDTGSVIEQVTFPVPAEDSFATYPLLHVAAGVPPLIAAVRAALDGQLVVRPPRTDLPSGMRSHPTAWGYLAARIRYGVR